MSDLISRHDAIAIATQEGAYGYISAQELADMPSAEPEVKTRCHNCIYSRVPTNRTSKYLCCDQWLEQVDPDGYCYKGEPVKKYYKGENK